jgi:hypothetical protein
MNKPFQPDVSEVLVKSFSKPAGCAVFLGFSLLALGLAAQQSLTFGVSGQPGSLKVLQVQGHNYVEVDGLARLLNGSITSNGSQILLTLHGAGTALAPPPEPAGFSKAFLTAAIEDLARTREWHSTLKTAIERSVPLDTIWLSPYQAKAQESLSLASVAVTTDSDKSGYQLLQNVFNRMKELQDKYVQLTNARTYFPPDSLQSDRLDQRLISCGHSLAAMAAAKQFVDDGSCQ